MQDEEFPDLGLIPVKDEETGLVTWVNTGDKKVREAFVWDALKRNARLKEVFSRSGVDAADIGTHQSYVKPLMTLFKNGREEDKMKHRFFNYTLILCFYAALFIKPAHKIYRCKPN